MIDPEDHAMLSTINDAPDFTQWFVSLENERKPFVTAAGFKAAVTHARSAWKRYGLRSHLTTSQSRWNPQKNALNITTNKPISTIEIEPVSVSSAILLHSEERSASRK